MYGHRRHLGGEVGVSVPRELIKCKCLMFELDFVDLGEEEAMDIPNPWP